MFDKGNADASRVEAVESVLLSGICGPFLAAVHQCADNTGIVTLPSWSSLSVWGWPTLVK